MDLTGADGGLLAGAFAAGCVASWGFLKGLIIGPNNKAYEAQITFIKNEHERCNERVSFLEMLLYQHGTGEMREMMQLALSARDLEKRDPAAAAKAAPHAIFVPASKEGGPP